MTVLFHNCVVWFYFDASNNRNPPISPFIIISTPIWSMGFINTIVCTIWILMPKRKFEYICYIEWSGYTGLMPIASPIWPQTKNLASRLVVLKWVRQPTPVKSMPISHPNFRDHMSRNDVSFQNIRNYILENPMKWINDEWHY